MRPTRFALDITTLGIGLSNYTKASFVVFGLGTLIACYALWRVFDLADEVRTSISELRDAINEQTAGIEVVNKKAKALADEPAYHKT